MRKIILLIFVLSIFFIAGCFGEAKTEEDALLELIREATNGNSNAQVELSLRHKLGDGVVKSYAEANSLAISASQQGNPDGQAILGFSLFFGEGVPTDRDQGIKLLKKAAQEGSILAQEYLLICYSWVAQDDQVKRIERKILPNLTKAADEGLPLAQYMLGERYLNGRGVDKDKKKAFELLAEAAKKGHIKAKATMLFNWKKEDLSKQIDVKQTFFEILRREPGIIESIKQFHPELILAGNMNDYPVDTIKESIKIAANNRNRSALGMMADNDQTEAPPIKWKVRFALDSGLYSTYKEVIDEYRKRQEWVNAVAWDIAAWIIYEADSGFKKSYKNSIRKIDDSIYCLKLNTEERKEAYVISIGIVSAYIDSQRDRGKYITGDARVKYINALQNHFRNEFNKNLKLLPQAKSQYETPLSRNTFDAAFSADEIKTLCLPQLDKRDLLQAQEFASQIKRI